MTAIARLGLALVVSLALPASADVPPPIEPEPLGRVETLPERYPDHWVLVDEVSFPAMFSGKVIVLDITEPRPGHRIKGMVDKSLIGNFTQHPRLPEFYVIESFHERGSRGRKYEYLTIYDKRTLAPVKEILWPTDRLQALPERYSMTVSGNGRFLFVANFTPAASFSVVDTRTHAILSEIATPGCVLTYPVGPQSVGSVCSDGTFLTSVVDDEGQLLAAEYSEPFFDSDDSPIFERPGIIDGIAHFPGYLGEIHSFDVSADRARYLGRWTPLSEAEQAADWRPGGIAVSAVDDEGMLYLIMHPDGADGTQGAGGSQVWVIDPETRSVARRLDAPGWAVSIEVTPGPDPYLVITNGEMNLDVLEAKTGKLLQTVSDFGNVTPLLVHKVR